MTRYRYHYLAVVLALFVLVTSCSDALDSVDTAGGQTDLICFDVNEVATSRSGVMSEERLAAVLPLVNDSNADTLYLNATVSDFPSAKSRAAMYDSDNYTLQGFEVLCKMQKGSDEPICYFDQIYTLNGGVYTGLEEYYWPSSAWTMNFYAVDHAFVDKIDNQDITFDYTVSTEIGDQKDLLYATSKDIPGNYNKALPLDFRHAFAAVKFKVTQLPDGYYVKSIKLVNVKYSGTYNFETASWTYADDTQTFAYSDDSGLAVNANQELTSDSNCFLMLPQSFAADDVNPKVEIVISDGDADRYYRALLEGSEWKENQVYTYAISVEKAYEFTLDELVEDSTVDAHYVIKKISLPDYATTYLSDSEEWSIEVDYDNTGTTVVLDAEANDYIKKGYWTDRYLDENGNDMGSARGAQKVTGRINDAYRAIYVMIPENTSTTSREIMLTVTIRGEKFKEYVITQLPAVDGWEQIDESEASEFGFNWDRKANYIYPYTYQITDPNASNDYGVYCASVIADNNAESYATVGEFGFSYWYGFMSYSRGKRHYIGIDYSKLNNLMSHGYSNSDDGHANTVVLKNIAGTSIGTTFEDILTSIMKTETGKTEQNAFRLPENPNGNGHDETQDLAAPSGSNSNNSAAVGECLKKNRYDIKLINTETVDESNNKIVMEEKTLVIGDDDVVWYLPSVAEYSSYPTDIQDAISPADYWSSNIDDSDASVAKNGTGANIDRNEKLHVRAKRK